MARKRKAEQTEETRKRAKEEKEEEERPKQDEAGDGTSDRQTTNGGQQQDVPKEEAIDPTAKTEDTLDLSPEQRDLYDRVQKLKPTIPRFLFRYWTSQSMGDARCNTAEAIIPPPFLEGQAPGFYKIPAKEIVRTAATHIHGRALPTLFSSWSHSLAFVLFMAGHDTHRTGHHICILDTSRLDRDNVILHTSQFRDVFGNSDVYVYTKEYLAFGIIQGPAYKAVPLSLIKEQSPQGPPGQVYQPDAIKKIAQLYKRDFEIAIAANLAGSPLEHADFFKLDRVDYVEEFKSLHIPSDWHEDPKLAIPSTVSLWCQMDAVRPMKLISDLMDISKGKKPLPAAAEKKLLWPDVFCGVNKADVDKLVNQGMHPREALAAVKKKAMEALFKKVPREVRDLLFNAHAYEHAVRLHWAGSRAGLSYVLDYEMERSFQWWETGDADPDNDLSGL